MRTRFVVSLLGLVLVAGGAPAVAAPQHVPGDQPLPGYTVNNPPLRPEVVDGQPTRVLQGIHQHSAYVVEVPAKWNGRLAMWAHGYRGTGTVLTVDPPAYGLRTRMLGQGYAWAASSYYSNGYDVRAGVSATHDLARHFGTLVARPKQVFIAGVSMGGHVIGRSLEQYPGFYDGALPMCGVLGDHELFDFFLDYQLTAQALAGTRAYPIPADYQTAVVPRIQEKLGLNGLVPGGPDTVTDRGAQFRANVVELSGGPRPGSTPAFAFWKDFLFGLAAPADDSAPLSRDPGRLATNLGTRYQPNTPVDLNRAVQRVAPRDWRTRFSPALTEVPAIAGRPGVPVLSLHGLGDLFVPFSMEQDYRADVVRRGQSKLLVQRAIRTVDHCEFSPAEAGAAWDDLVAWTDRGRKPAGDAIGDRAAVASPAFGCRFSDRAAYNGPGTRRLFSSCPVN
ncbi:alpha/beta hydrolase family protein [Lentzea sp. HUAS TT2]|uniref:alpha/beta hydrolase family protein n=1 Tax=Lentzea sp. HUAS TT2 TaxID=3447454 RepID=UPI003F6E8C1C